MSEVDLDGSSSTLESSESFETSGSFAPESDLQSQVAAKAMLCKE
jgi:hypothetical protein